MTKRVIFSAVALGLIASTGCHKKTEAPPGMTVTADASGARRLEGAPVPADAPPQVREAATAASAEAQYAAQQNTAMAKGLKAARP